VRKAQDLTSQGTRLSERTNPYWWTEEIAAGRVTCNRVRRVLQRGRRQGQTPETEEVSFKD